MKTKIKRKIEIERRVVEEVNVEFELPCFMKWHDRLFYKVVDENTCIRATESGIELFRSIEVAFDGSHVPATEQEFNQQYKKALNAITKGMLTELKESVEHHSISDGITNDTQENYQTK
jgi:hypothetical protein